MRFLANTDVLSQSAKQHPHPSAIAWMRRKSSSGLATTVVSIAEIECGIERQRQSGAANACLLQAWLEALLGTDGPAIWPLCTDGARLLGRMHVRPALRNPILSAPAQTHVRSGADLAIAAIAIVRGAKIATRNMAHFCQIHTCFPLLGLYNPFMDD